MFQTPLFQNYEDIATFNQANLDAVMASTAVLTRGIEACNRICFDYARGVYQRSVTVAQAMARAKSPEEAVELQGAYATAFVDNTVAQGKKLTDFCLGVANDAAAPIQARMDVTMATLKLPKAA